MKRKYLISLPLISIALNASAEFEAQIDPYYNPVSVTVRSDSEDKSTYTQSYDLPNTLKVKYRGSCDEGQLREFFLILGNVKYEHEIDGEKKSVSGNNGSSWLVRSFKGKEVANDVDKLTLIKACNDHVNAKVNQGFDLETVLGSDFSVANAVKIPLKLGFRCIYNGDSEGYLNSIVDNLNVTANCKATNYQPPIQVDGLEFRIDKQVSLGGLCKVSLKGALNTSRPSQLVRFRYEHIDHSFNKKLSQIHQVTTDQQGYANFAHDYAVANGPGKEKGRMRVLGVSHEFQSEQLNYSMNCKDGGPGGLQQAGKSTIKLEAKAIKNSNQSFGNQICPTKLKFTGTIKAGNDFSGKAVFVGQSILDIQSKNFSVKKGKTKRVSRTIDLKWAAPSMTTLATGGGISTPMMTQNIMQSLNIVGDNSQTVILSVPRKSFSVSCSTGSVQPSLQTQNGSFNTFPSHTGGGAPTDLQINQQSVTPIIPAKPKPIKKVKRKLKKQNENNK